MLCNYLYFIVGEASPPLFVNQYFGNSTVDQEEGFSLYFGDLSPPFPDWEIFDQDYWDYYGWSYDWSYESEASIVSPQTGRIDLPLGTYHLLFSVSGRNLDVIVTSVDVTDGTCSTFG